MTTWQRSYREDPYLWGVNDLFLHLETSHFLSPILNPSPCPFSQYSGNQSLIQRLAGDSSFWAEIPQKRCEEPGRRSMEGGKGNTRMCCRAIIHCWGQLGLNSFRTFWTSVMPLRSMSPRDEEESLYSPSSLTPLDLQLSRVVTWRVNSLVFPVLCSSE